MVTRRTPAYPDRHGRRPVIASRAPFSTRRNEKGRPRGRPFSVPCDACRDQPSPCLAFAAFETHLPNALAFVPYRSPKAAREAARSCAHRLAARLRFAACSRSCASALSSPAFAVWDTHLPIALAFLAFVPYFSPNALRDSAVVPRSALHACAALDSAWSRSEASSRALADTHLPKARYFAANASRVASVLPRS